MKVTPQQIKAARRLLGWSRIEVALKSSVGATTVYRIETNRPGRHDQAVVRLQAVFEAAGIVFDTENGGSGVRLRKPNVE